MSETIRLRLAVIAILVFPVPWTGRRCRRGEDPLPGPRGSVWMGANRGITGWGPGAGPSRHSPRSDKKTPIHRSPCWPAVIPNWPYRQANPVRRDIRKEGCCVQTGTSCTGLACGTKHVGTLNITPPAMRRRTSSGAKKTTRRQTLCSVPVQKGPTKGPLADRERLPFQQAFLILVNFRGLLDNLLSPPGFASQGAHLFVTNPVSHLA